MIKTVLSLPPGSAFRFKVCVTHCIPALYCEAFRIKLGLSCGIYVVTVQVFMNTEFDIKHSVSLIVKNDHSQDPCVLNFARFHLHSSLSTEFGTSCTTGSSQKERTNT